MPDRQTLNANIPSAVKSLKCEMGKAALNVALFTD